MEWIIGSVIALIVFVGYGIRVLGNFGNQVDHMGDGQ